MTLTREHEGQYIEFDSLKCGHIYARLISFNKDHIQVELLADVNTKTRLWQKGAVRLFDTDKILDVKLLTDLAIVKPVHIRLNKVRKVFHRKDSERKQKQSRMLLYHRYGNTDKSTN